eukprot:c41043_g1_i1.p1 GENE.c41043_g1_i1~~c41043_g1_i1.p1  ORF type:complete len:195 (-),score=11.78 c41043_g1_i1:21-563(-)
MFLAQFFKPRRDHTSKPEMRSSRKRALRQSLSELRLRPIWPSKPAGASVMDKFDDFILVPCNSSTPFEKSESCHFGQQSSSLQSMNFDDTDPRLGQKPISGDERRENDTNVPRTRKMNYEAWRRWIRSRQESILRKKDKCKASARKRTEIQNAFDVWIAHAPQEALDNLVCGHEYCVEVQ